MKSMSIGSDHTVASMRSLRQIAAKGENAQLTTLKLVTNGRRAPLKERYNSARRRRVTSKVRRDIDVGISRGKTIMDKR